MILVGLGRLQTEDIGQESCKLYVAMTRALECLLVTASGATQKIESITAAKPLHLAPAGFATVSIRNYKPLYALFLD